MKTIHITSQDDLPDVAEAVIEALGRRTVVAFRGEMGAGKTTLIREIAAQLGATDTVTSPTFAIVNQYKGKGGRRIHHFDFYRINDVREAYDFGYEEYFYSGDLCLVEWPEKIEQLLPDNAMTVRITVDSDTARTFEIDSHSEPAHTPGNTPRYTGQVAGRFMFRRRRRTICPSREKSLLLQAAGSGRDKLRPALR